MKTDITRKDEEKFLKLKIAENSVFDAALTFDDLISAIGDGRLPLEVSDDDGSRVIDDSSIEEIKKVIPCLLKIVCPSEKINFSRPKLFFISTLNALFVTISNFVISPWS